MKVNSSIATQRAELHLEQNRIAIEHLTKQKKKTQKSRDTYAKSPQPRYFSYTKKDVQKSENELYEGYLPMDFINMLNGDNDSEIGVTIDGDSLFQFKGIYFTRKNIPEIPKEEFEEIKAVNNVVDFGKSNYFKYVSSSGQEYRLYSRKGGHINLLETDRLLGKDGGIIPQRYASFWNYCMDQDVLFMNLPGIGFTREEEHKYLEEMGLDYGFITIKMGDKENILYRTKSQYKGELISKDRYDIQYESMRSSDLGKNFGAGAVITIGEEEYTFDENCRIDIPYGADIFNVKYPPVIRNIRG